MPSFLLNEKAFYQLRELPRSTVARYRHHHWPAVEWATRGTENIGTRQVLRFVRRSSYAQMVVRFRGVLHSAVSLFVTTFRRDVPSPSSGLTAFRSCDWQYFLESSGSIPNIFDSTASYQRLPGSTVTMNMEAIRVSETSKKAKLDM
jgi:hypothetical protein